MRICLIAGPGDAIAHRLADIAAMRGAETISVALDGAAVVAFDGEAWLVSGEEISNADAFVVRKYLAPGAPLSADPAASLTAAEWWRRGIEQLERSHFVWSCLLDLERSGKPMVNPPGASGPYDHKPLQLSAFRRAGLPIPRTLITNFGRAVELFRAEVPEVIAKPIAGGAEAHTLEELAPNGLGAMLVSPAIFQERIRGADIRVTLVGDRVVSAVEIPSETLDYRSGAAYRAGAVEYRPHALAPSVVELCRTAARLSRQVLSGVDLKLRPSGEYVLIEANSSPVYLDIELRTGAPISEAVVEYLLERSAM